MKKTKKCKYISTAIGLATCAVWLAMPLAAPAQVVIGSFQGAGDPTDTGWTDLSDNQPITTSTNCSFVSGAVSGYGQSLALAVPAANAGSFGFPSIKLSFSPAQIQAFNTNSWITFTFSVPTNNAGGYSQVFNLAFNATTYGYNNHSWATAVETGDTNNDSAGSGPNFYFNAGSAARSQVVTVNYSDITNAIISGGEGFLQMTLQGNQGGGAPISPAWYLNGITLSQSPFGVAQVATYTVDDFNTNGVNPFPPNPPGNDYYAAAPEPYEPVSDDNIANVWSQWFGSAFTGVQFNPNLNVSGNTNANGSMALQLAWDSIDSSTTYQQFVLWQGNGNTYVPVNTNGTAGIGFPAYTNLSCDVMFDPSSVTNPAGIYGVLRLGIRGFAAFGTDWEPQANYVTITDTNWHHINCALSSANSDDLNIGGPIIGEDVNAYVGTGTNGLNGNQILYIDNIKFTGPLNAPPIPPPTVGTTTKATPGLRIFAGSSVNTYDREMLYNVDNNDSWAAAGVTYPVSYTFSLQDYNPNIGQVMAELMPGTASGAGEFPDYSGNNTLWLQLNPGPVAGQVLAQVQWKTNAPGSNPGGTGANAYGQALEFTNSTAVGKWSLVFTDPNNGYVVAPGTVITGPTNFNIADGTVATDFPNPLYVAFGIQPNSTAGEGQWIDWGMMAVTGIADGNQFEDFTKESGDVVANITPSGMFNNSDSALPASTVIQTTNDAWWINWTQPAVAFTLTSTTNLLKGPWINPGWYSAYSDTNAPRVMAGATPFGGKFWVLLPQDDLPTANGQQNTYSGINGGPGPASQKLAPNAFFELSTNTVSP